MPEENFKKQLEIDENDLNRELTKQPGLYSRWGILAVEAKSYRDKLEEVLKVADAKIEDEIRTKAEKENRKYKITGGEILSKLLQDPRHTKAMADYLKAKKEADILWVGAREAFAQRKDCLISLAANLREELDSQLTIRRKKVDEITRRSK